IVKHRDPMVPKVYWRLDFEPKPYHHAVQGAQCLVVLCSRCDDFPINEASPRACRTRRWSAVPLPTRHRRLISGNDFVGRAILANRTIIDPHHAVAKAPTLVELVR